MNLNDKEREYEGEEEDHSSSSDDIICIGSSTKKKKPTPKKKTKHVDGKKKKKNSSDEESKKKKKKSGSKKRKSDTSSSEEEEKKKKKKKQQRQVITKKTEKRTRTEIDITEDVESSPKKKSRSREPPQETPKAPSFNVSKSRFYKDKKATIQHLSDTLQEIQKQDEAIEQVIYKVYAQLLTPNRSKIASERICSLHLTGGSGIGKTRTAELIAQFLDIGHGTPYPNQYINTSLSKYTDPSHSVGITGTAGGLVGYNDVNMVDRLILATKPAVGREDEGVPFILLHLDEACKAHPNFMNALNPLLSDGAIANIKEKRFVIPDDTLLLIIWTSNFAEHIENPNANPEASVREVYSLMLKRGFEYCDIARMGSDPILYNPLSADDMYAIIEKKGSARLPLHCFTTKFGVPFYDNNNESGSRHDSNLLIHHILKSYSPSLGVRHPLEKYKTELDSLLTLADFLAQKQNEKKCITHPTWWFNQVAIPDDDSRENSATFLSKQPQLATAIKQNFKNRANFNLMFNNLECTSIDYIVLKCVFHDKPLYAYRILQPVLQTKPIASEQKEEETEIEAPALVVPETEPSFIEDWNLKFTNLQNEVNLLKNTIVHQQESIDILKAATSKTTTTVYMPHIVQETKKTTFPQIYRNGYIQ